MRIGVLGTGTVGRTIAAKLIEFGHEVCMGSRETGNERAVAWAREHGKRAREGDFADAATGAELVFNCTAGTASLAALEAAGVENLAGKIVVDVANPLDISAGPPPTLSIANDDSLAERIQRAFPATRVVKTLNTVNARVMTDPDRVPGEHTVFLSGDDEAAKDAVAELLQGFGWPRERILDLGGIATARGVEMYLPLWLSLYGALGTTDLNVAVLKA